jgi:hypothetical protein
VCRRRIEACNAVILTLTLTLNKVKGNGEEEESPHFAFQASETADLNLG